MPRTPVAAGESGHERLYNATVELSCADRVRTFTAPDFGRFQHPNLGFLG